MANISSSSLKTSCTTCSNKAGEIFRCEGCSNEFCRKHLNDHRDLLSHQLDEIVLERDILHQTMVENQRRQNHQHPILKEIDQWEKNSIAKIQQLAEEARQQVIHSTCSQTVSKELHDLAERVQKARIDDNFLETDLRTWTTTLQKLKDGMNLSAPSIFLQEDRTQAVIGRMFLSDTAHRPSKQTEKFKEFFGSVRLDEDGLLATQCGVRNDTALVRGSGEYSSGKHNIRFLFKKNDAEYITSFEIVSKLMPINGSNSSYRLHGWSSLDEIYSCDVETIVDEHFQDMKDQTEFEIELQLDCENRKISYVNQRTKTRREMNVNITKCPFPWQIEFYMFTVGDCVRLVS